MDFIDENSDQTIKVETELELLKEYMMKHLKEYKTEKDENGVDQQQPITAKDLDDIWVKEVYEKCYINLKFFKAADNDIPRDENPFKIVHVNKVCVT